MDTLRQFNKLRVFSKLLLRQNKSRTLPQPEVVYKRSTHPTSVPIKKLFSSKFPYSVKQSAIDFQHRHEFLHIQNDLLSLLPFFPHADSIGRTSEVIHTEVTDSGDFINEFVIYPPNYTPDQYTSMNHLIMVHGYGGGLGFYLKNYNQIAQNPNWIIHSIDLLGYGCSSRTKFTCKNLSEVEHFFHDSFQQWMIKRGLVDSSKNLILAHSMGGYLMATYGIKHIEPFCSKLLMISPGAVIKHRSPVAVPKYFVRLWEQNISPFSLVRKFGPLGSKLVSMWSSRRFGNLSKKESSRLHKYAYAIFQRPGSGEYMLNFLLAPGADARHPLIERGVHKLNCGLLWCYGKEDWMDKKGGELISNVVNSLHGTKKSSVVEIEDSGHHIYLDNIKEFNKLVVDEMEKFGRRKSPPTT